MVDVSAKRITQRTAEAAGTISMNKEAFQAILKGMVPKGDVFGAARVAGILAAKQTAILIPLCHPLQIQAADIELKPDAKTRAVECRSSVKVKDRTGAEMEALTAVAVALLTIYDMCKALDPCMTISNLRLIKKTGGKSRTFTRP
jgi:cyclic pyranopterin phosphate synthase